MNNTLEIRTKHTLADFYVGQEIYYTGDMANCEGFGIIMQIQPPSKFCSCGLVNIRMEDGREMLGLYVNMFDPGPGRRFWLKDDWRTDRQQRMEEMQQRMEEMQRTRTARTA